MVVEEEKKEEEDRAFTSSFMNLVLVRGEHNSLPLVERPEK